MNFNPNKTINSGSSPSGATPINHQGPASSLLTQAFIEVPALQASGEASGVNTYTVKAVEVYPGLTHLENSRALLHELIQAPRELHFFWGFGREIKDYPVKIGGEKYHEAFKKYLTKLLEVSPAALRVVLALDEGSFEANKTWIEPLIHTYKNRLEVRLVSAIQEKLEKTYPEHVLTIESIFTNAEAGNPVIASDIYRLLAMVDPEKVDSTIFTYCDVDTFVYGCEASGIEKITRPQFDFNTRKRVLIEKEIEVPDHKDLLQALFQEPTFTPTRSGFFAERNPNESFFLSRPMERETGYKNNDIVKFKVNALKHYQDFSRSILDHLNRHLSDAAKPLNILNYFTTLHSFIKACEGKNEEALKLVFNDYLDTFNSQVVLMKDVIQVTGPGLLDKRPECSPLRVVHPRVATWGWHGTELLEHESAEPLEGFSSSLTSFHQALNHFKSYVNRIHDALYAQKFGENHPFYLHLKAYLESKFPYEQGYFQDLLKEAYADASSRRALPVYEEWKESYLKTLQAIPEGRTINPEDSYYAKLLDVLKALGIRKE